jgi:hypothetical protein
MSSKSIAIASTFSESRAKYVMGKIADDFTAIAARRFPCLKPYPNWLQELKEDLFFIMIHEDLELFQFQFKHSGKDRAIEYRVKSDGTIYADDESGKIDYWLLPDDVEISVVVRRYGDPKVWMELQKNGWTNNGSMVEGNVSHVGSYSKDGYGATKQLIGWD